MTKMKTGLKLLCILITASMLFSACGSGTNVSQTETTASASTESAGSAESTAAVENTDPLGKYENLVEITATRVFNPTLMKFQKGEDLDNNIWTRGLEKDLGIKVKYLWTTPDDEQYKNRMNIALASNDLPDVMFLQGNLFHTAARGDRLEPLDEALEKYGSDDIKAYVDESQGYARKASTKDGKLFAIPIPPDIAGSPELMWIDNVWLKKLNLEPPKTMADFINIAKAFANNDPDGDNKKNTFGIAINKELFGGVASLKGFFNGFHAYPNQWLEKGGKLEFGSLQPEMKAALQAVADLYSAGAINKEFGIQGPWAESPADLEKNKYGMFFGPNWVPYWPLNNARAALIKAGKEPADWQAYMPVSADAQPVLLQCDSRTITYYSVRKGFEHPEALVKLSNYSWAKAFDTDPKSTTFEDAFHHVIEDGVNIDTFNYNLCMIGEVGGNVKDYKKFMKAMETNDDSVVQPSVKAKFNEMKDFIANKTESAWAAFAVFGPTGSESIHTKIYDEKLHNIDNGYGPEVLAWTEKWGNLKSKEEELFTKVIMGNTTVEEGFNQWVKYWNEQGGQEITQQMNEWWSTK